MKTLAQYLAEYIDTESERVAVGTIVDIDRLWEWIEQGIEAYQSTENCTITTTKQYACESCSLVKTDVVWRDETEQYECEECYQAWRKEKEL